MVGMTRRLSQVFVELRTLPSSADHKENALSVPQMNSKRKLDIDGPVPAEPAAKKQHAMPQSTANATDDYPNGFVYCHQCNKKRDVTVSVRCTTTDRGRRCNAKYCKPCLKNRYGLLLENILAGGETDQGNHAHGEGYHFRCPRCNDICNCVACRKAKGLQPTGNLANAARKSGLASAADVLRRDPKAAGPMANKPGEKKTHLQPPGHGTASKHDTLSAPAKGGPRLPAQPSKSHPQPKSKPPPKPKVKALPKPKLLAKPCWTSVETALSRTEVEERVNIREFALRFSSILQLSRSHLDELEEIRASRTRNREDADDDLVPWVSEACLKSLLLGLLNIVDVKGDRDKHFKATVKSIRESGSHLNKMWAALATLRDWQESTSKSSRSTPTSSLLSFPDPLPPPESVSIIRTRSGANQSNTGSVNVLRTSQLVPVIAALVDAAVESEAVRQELEAGTQESKERVKEAREAHRIENERFEQEKKTGKRLDKSRTQSHKRIVATIDHALKLSSYANITRISPLGRDMDGRIYWALTPGMSEREDALALLQSYCQERTHKSKSRRKPLVPSEEDRSALTKWSWFVAVWGQRPSVAERTLDDDDSEEDEDDEDEQWWGFWEPEEIMKLASWIHFKAGLGNISSRSLSAETDVDMRDLTDDEISDDQSDDDDIEADMTPTNREIAALVRELERYASLLGERIQKDE